ncbi:MAG TPA: ABC transporter permease [Polyangiaceae bacterium]|jgi:putative ABC transport system permease protein|nr:ABC transporter permease [Polyangiaceae bacterium]
MSAQSIEERDGASGERERSPSIEELAAAEYPSVAGTSVARPGLRIRAMARVAIRMMFHDKLKLLGTVSGVVFAVVLAVQQLSILFGLLEKNTMFVDSAGADIWLVPPNTELLQPGERMSETVLTLARTTPGVELAEPLLFTAGTLKKPNGGSEPVSLVGTTLPARLGGPWNIVAGDASAIAEPDTMFFEDSEREKYGGLNLGSIRELNGHRVRVGGFTWGLLPFGPAYCFGDIDLVRTLTTTPTDRANFVLVKTRPGADVFAVQRALAARVPEVLALTREQYSKSIVVNLLKQQLGMSFGISTSFGLIIGFVIVSLSMFSSVIDNLREFGTLKAIGCTNKDLTVLLLVQSVVYALIGSFVGLGVVTRVALAIRNPKLVPIIPNVILAIVPFVMLFLCIIASVLALSRIRKLEPAMVFR